MGVSVDCVLFIGVSGQNLKKVTEITHVTRYDEVTGEPYQKPVNKTVWKFGNKECDDSFDLKDYGLDTHVCCYDDSVRLIGKRVLVMGDALTNNSEKYIEPEILAEKIEALQKKLASDFGIVEKVKVWLTSYVG